MAIHRPPFVDDLARLAPSETTPLWLEVARAQAARRSAANLLAQRANDRFVAPSPLDLRLAHRLDGLALDAARDFEAILLSPVAPLGACSVVALTSQDRVLSAARGTEVVSDPTNVLALECARRLAVAPHDVRLATVHQTLRAQPLPEQPGFTRHFRLFVMAEAGLGQSSDGFEVGAIVRQLGVLVDLADACERALGAVFANRIATVYAAARRATMATRVEAMIRNAHPALGVERAPLEKGYYDGLRVTFSADTVAGERCPIGDLGVFDWMPKLTSDARTRFVASGFGLQLVPLLYVAAGT